MNFGFQINVVEMGCDTDSWWRKVPTLKKKRKWLEVVFTPNLGHNTIQLIPVTTISLFLYKENQTNSSTLMDASPKLLKSILQSEE